MSLAVLRKSAVCGRKLSLGCKKSKTLGYPSEDIQLFTAAGGESYIAKISSNYNTVVFGTQQLSMSKILPQNAMLYFKICLLDWAIDHKIISVLGFSSLIYAKHLDGNIRYLSSVTLNLICAEEII